MQQHNEFNTNIVALESYFTDTTQAVFFTGAGMSTESGVPDFRTPNGVWARYPLIDFADFMRSAEMRDEAWRNKIKLDEEIGEVQPNRGHLKIAQWVAQKRVSHVITQNIDNLHQQSGIAPEQVIELHGNGTYAKCLSCDARYDIEAMKKRFMETQAAPHCDVCGGVVKSATVSFGQAMPEPEMARALKASQNCELFIAVGSSLVVAPANQFPLIAKESGAPLIIINHEPTPLDAYADLAIHHSISDVLAALDERLG